MEDAQSSARVLRRGKLKTFLFLLGFSALEIYAYLNWDQDPEDWRLWVVAGSAVFFPVMTLISGISLAKNWSTEREDRIATRTFVWLFATPFILAAAAAGFLVFFSVFGWFGTIPSWAAVIIILLVALLLKR